MRVQYSEPVESRKRRVRMGEMRRVRTDQVVGPGPSKKSQFNQVMSENLPLRFQTVD